MKRELHATWISTTLAACASCALTGCPEIFQAPPAATEQGAEANSIEAETPETERVKAEAGVAKAGRSLDGETGVAGIIVEPAKQLFSFKENAVFKLQIPQAMQFFQATEGQFPQSQDEFMTKIVRANNLRLPDLPPGQRYVYDPKRGELMVERPAN